jgi:hypothetical protein
MLESTYMYVWKVIAWFSFIACLCRYIYFTLWLNISLDKHYLTRVKYLWPICEIVESSCCLSINMQSLQNTKQRKEISIIIISRWSLCCCFRSSIIRMTEYCPFISLFSLIAIPRVNLRAFHISYVPLL